MRFSSPLNLPRICETYTASHYQWQLNRSYSLLLCQRTVELHSGTFYIKYCNTENSSEIYFLFFPGYHCPLLHQSTASHRGSVSSVGQWLWEASRKGNSDQGTVYYTKVPWSNNIYIKYWLKVIKVMAFWDKNVNILGSLKLCKFYLKLTCKMINFEISRTW